MVINCLYLSLPSQASQHTQSFSAYTSIDYTPPTLNFSTSGSSQKDYTSPVFISAQLFFSVDRLSFFWSPLRCRYLTKIATCLGGEKEQGKVLRALPQVLPRPRGTEQEVFPYIFTVAASFGCATRSCSRLFWLHEGRKRDAEAPFPRPSQLRCSPLHPM